MHCVLVCSMFNMIKLAYSKQLRARRVTATMSLACVRTPWELCAALGCIVCVPVNCVGISAALYTSHVSKLPNNTRIMYVLQSIYYLRWLLFDSTTIYLRNRHYKCCVVNLLMINICGNVKKVLRNMQWHRDRICYLKIDGAKTYIDIY